MRRLRWLTLCVSAGAMTGGWWGCVSSGEDTCVPGTETCACYGNGTCNAGLECLSGLCVDASADGDDATGEGDAATTADTDTGDASGDASASSSASGDGDGDGDGDDSTSTSGDGDGDGDGSTSTSGDGDGDGDGDGSTSTSGDGDGDGSTSTSGDGDGDTDCQLSDVLLESDWDAMFLHKDDAVCYGGIYTYAGLLTAAEAYPSFGCEGTEEIRRREVAAFLAQISHETTGGWATAPDGPYSWGLCFIEEVGCEGGNCTQYCDAGNTTYPCASGETYHGRGAMQLSWNYNYGQAGEALGVDLLGNPDLVATDSALATQTALWFWMTEQLPKPSAHDVMVGNWVPTFNDLALGRFPGFGMTTNIINGGLECGFATPSAVVDRVGFFERYAMLLSTTVGDNLYCDQMASY